MYLKKLGQGGNSLEVQWLGLHAFTAEGLGSIPGQGTKIPQAARRDEKKKENFSMIFPSSRTYSEPRITISNVNSGIFAKRPHPSAPRSSMVFFLLCYHICCFHSLEHHHHSPPLLPFPPEISSGPIPRRSLCWEHNATR